jgi:hypothetical protein
MHFSSLHQQINNVTHEALLPERQMYAPKSSVTTFEQLSEIHLHRHIDVADPAGKLN